ncbi:MAG: hypothetical protein ND866_14360, partial [Pyrinomonadaceae bacterium]|nr:hypothetical protein [Pyrinomonadaceae bacterium]
IVSCILTSSGLHTIQAFDSFNGTFTGGYNLYLQRLNNPGNTVSISFGQTVPGSIDGLADVDTYTFTANVGDRVLVRMMRFCPWVCGNSYFRYPCLKNFFF